MPAEPMILRVHFYHAQGTKRQALGSGVHHVDYMLSPDKSELLVDVDRTTLESAAIHAKYAEEREGSLGSFGSVSQAEARRQIRMAQGPVWRLIVSVGEADALAMPNGLTTKAGWASATQEVLPHLIRGMGLDRSQTQWIAAAHRKQAKGERNPHIHLLLWEQGTPTRRTGKLKIQEIATIRRAFARVLYRPELERVGRAKTAARTAAKAITHALLSAEPSTVALEQRVVRELTDRLIALAPALPPKGRLAYAYLPASTKTEVLDLARWLSENQPDLRAAKTEFLEAAATYASVHWSPPEGTEWGGSEQAQKRQQALQQARATADQDFHQRLVPELLKAARSLRSRRIDPALQATVAANRKLRAQITADPEKAVAILQAHHPAFSPVNLRRQVALLKDQWKRQSVQHRTQVSRAIIHSALHGLTTHTAVQRYAAYLTAKEQWQKAQAESELAAAQGYAWAR